MGWWIVDRLYALGEVGTVSPTLYYNYGKQRLLAGLIHPTTDTIKAMLVDSTYTADADTQYVTTFAAKRIGTDVTLTDPAIALMAGDHTKVVVTFADPVWGAVAPGSTVGGVVLYAFGTVDADSIPICLFDVIDYPTDGSSLTLPLPTAANGGALQLG